MTLSNTEMSESGEETPTLDDTEAADDASHPADDSPMTDVHNEQPSSVAADEPLADRTDPQLPENQFLMEDSDSHANDEVKALLQAIHIMSRLASMDAAKYTATMAPAADAGPTDGALALQHQLDELQQKWKLEETSVPTVAQQIHRLQSHVSHLEREQDQHTMDWQQHLDHESASQARIRQLERAVQKLHRKTEKLQKKLKEKQKERKSIVRQVKDYVGQVKKQEEQNAEDQILSHQVYAHERLLRLEHSLGRSNDLGGGNRSRCTSNDSVFSDFDVAALYPMDHDESSLASSASSVSTSHSTVTEDGIATVRYHSGDEPMTPPQQRQQHEQHNYQLTFPQGTKIGLQFHRVPLDKPKKGLLDDAFAADGLNLEDPMNKMAVPDDVESPLQASNSDRSFSMHFNLDALLGKNQGPSAAPPQEDPDLQYGFLICGHHGFDSDLNVPPALGARLVKVNDESVNKWTLEMIRDATHTSDESFTMTFCNEPLNQRQKDILNKAVKAADQQHEAEEERKIHPNGAGETEHFRAQTPTRPMLPSFLQLNPNAEAKAEVAVAKLDVSKEKGSGRSMLSSFLQINQNGTVVTARENSAKSSSENSNRGSDDGLPTGPLDVSYKGGSPEKLPPASNGKDQPVPETPPSEKLKKSMKSMGKKFKGWMS